MSTQELVTSIVAEQEDSVDQFVDLISQKIEDAIEVKRIELASQMFEAKGMCPECEKPTKECECEDEEDDEDDDDMEEMDEGYRPHHTNPKPGWALDPATKAKFAEIERKRAVKAKYVGKSIPKADSMKEEVEQISEGPQRKNTRALNKLRDASAGAKYKRSGMPVPEPGPQHKTAQAYNKALGRGLRKMGEEAEQVEEMADRVTVDKITTELGRGKGLPPKVTSNKIVVDKAAMDKLGTIKEMAPPGAKYERMIKYIKKGYSKGGLTKREKSIAYATAWKAKNREMSEAAMTDTQKMSALGMKGAQKAKTMQALTAYRKHGDINKLSAGHRSLLAGYMEKTGGLAAVNRGTATQALKKERMQEE